MLKKKPSEPSKPTKEPQTMDELLSATGYQLRGLKRGETVEGKIISITPSEILIDIGHKSLGVVSEREMDMVGDLLPTLAVGDKLFVQIVSSETEAGQIVLSVRRAGMEKKWQELLTKKEKAEPVEVKGIEVTRGGLIVDWQGVRGFIPASQLSPARFGKPETGVGEKIKAIILDVDKSTNRLVFSEKRVTQEEKIGAALAKLKIGETYEGTVSGIVPFGIFVSIAPPAGGLEGLVHISEIAWEKVTNPSDYFKIGQIVKVLVTSVDRETGKLNLSTKQLITDPWQELVKKYSSEQEVSGQVTKLTSFGVFVELEKGVEGLIHISKIPPGVTLKLGEKVNCVIEGIEASKRKISLTPILKEKPVGYR
ncbi:MAG: 30S ribosomal protein S1 [Microgenomates group bacterium LiPW_16]|nr:MAG: 30S ribosomal protein S1 [Microgenomates group bacterium LiPW_16]